MITIIRTDSKHSDFINLVKQLDADLAVRDGADHAFYSQFNSIAAIKHAVVVYNDNKPVGCGAIKQYAPEIMEVKRVFTLPRYRGKGIATIVMDELEKWTIELGYDTCVLETGNRQPEAIALYEKNGFTRIANYGQYIGFENSVCFEKKLFR